MSATIVPAYTVTAEREGSEARYITGANSMVEAAFAVEKMEEYGNWPEGYEAILTRNSDGKRWMYVDGWEAL